MTAYRLLCLVLVGLGAPAAQAAPQCEALDEPEFIALVLDGQAAVDRGDPDLHLGVVQELRRRIPCLSFLPRPRVLADYLVLDALAEFGQQGDWQAPLSAALRIRPGVDRIVGGAHPISRFQPVAPDSSERLPVPDGIRVYVDGEAMSAIPPVGELHLVQVAEDGRWRSGFFMDQPVPQAFLLDPIEAPLTWTWWGHASIAAGPGGVSQRRAAGWDAEPDQAAFVPEQDRVTAWPALVARGGASYGLIGVAAELDVGLAGLTRPVGSHVQATVVFGRSALRLGAGAGVGGSTKIQGVNTVLAPGAEPRYAQTSEGLAYAAVSALTVTERWDAGASFGLGPSTLRGSGFVGWSSEAEPGRLPIRLGVSGGVQRGWFVLGDVAADEATTVTWRGGFEVGVRL